MILSGYDRIYPRAGRASLARVCPRGPRVEPAAVMAPARSPNFECENGANRDVLASYFCKQDRTDKGVYARPAVGRARNTATDLDKGGFHSARSAPRVFGNCVSQSTPLLVDLGTHNAVEQFAGPAPTLPPNADCLQLSSGL